MDAPSTPEMEISVQSSGRSSGGLSRTLWRGCLIAVGSVAAIHAALAYSPSLVRYFPETLLDAANRPAPCHASMGQGCPSMGQSCRARPVLSGDFSACCSMPIIDAPILTDSLYQDDASDATTELPADAHDCFAPAGVSTESAAPDFSEPQASAADTATSATND